MPSRSKKVTFVEKAYIITLFSLNYIYFFATGALIIDFVKSITEGVAIHIEEYVPTTTPTSKANENPLIDSPPKINIVNRTKNVDKEVLRVLERVLFRALFTILF